MYNNLGLVPKYIKFIQEKYATNGGGPMITPKPPPGEIELVERVGAPIYGEPQTGIAPNGLITTERPPGPPLVTNGQGVEVNGRNQAAAFTLPGGPGVLLIGALILGAVLLSGKR